MDSQCAYLRFDYDNNAKYHIGELYKVNRICRFCGKSIPEITFNKKAHALSEFLGNKTIICREECDCCNDWFSKIEQDFFNRHAIVFPFYNIKGKRGTPKIKASKAEIFNTIYEDKSVLTIKSSTPIERCLHFKGKKGKMNFNFFLKNNAYVPQNIYKCLSKYALSVIDTQYLSSFTDTIRWITDENLFVNKLPLVIQFANSFLEHPRISYYIRQDSTTSFVYAFCIVEFANIGYAFIIPFAKGEKITMRAYLNFCNSFKTLYGNRNCVVHDFTGKERITMTSHFNIDNIILNQTMFEGKIEDIEDYIKK